MRILFLRGIFSTDEKNAYQGLICWCHFSNKDTEETVRKAIPQIVCRKKCKKKEEEEAIILVPFSGLDEATHTMPFDDACSLFRTLGENLPGAITTPFNTSTGFNLQLPGSAYVGFIEV
ncbi:MAG: hypothetical protein V4665_04300 [Patescibacteria group bacterium]